MEENIRESRSGRLAGWKRDSILNALEEFANMSKVSVSGVKQFRGKYPHFFPESSYDVAEGRSLWRGLQERDGIRFFRMYQRFLRVLWRGDKESRVWEPRLLDVLLGLEPDRLSPLPRIERDGWLPRAKAMADWQTGTFSYEPACEFQGAVWTLFQQKWRAKVCGRCSRLFVADKPTQLLCSQKCAGEIEKIRKRIWWAEHGKEWRAKRQAKNQRKRGK